MLIDRLPGFQPLPSLSTPLPWDDLCPSGQLFAVLDGALIARLPERLEASGLPHRRLLDVPDTDVDEVAPWLVALRPGNRLTQALFADPDKNRQMALWPTGAAMFILADTPLPDLSAHLKGFLRVTDAVDQVYFFRFWDRTLAPAYFAAIADDPGLLARWFRPTRGGQITALLIPDVETSSLIRIAPVPLVTEDQPPDGPFALRDRDIVALQAAVTARNLQRLAFRVAAEHPGAAATVDPGALAMMVKASVARLAGYGMVDHDLIVPLIAADLVTGTCFEDTDPTGRLRAICAADMAEGTKVAALRGQIGDVA
jgi:hypothetical protein